MSNLRWVTVVCAKPFLSVLRAYHRNHNIASSILISNTLHQTLPSQIRYSQMMATFKKVNASHNKNNRNRKHLISRKRLDCDDDNDQSKGKSRIEVDEASNEKDQATEQVSSSDKIAVEEALSETSIADATLAQQHHNSISSNISGIIAKGVRKTDEPSADTSSSEDEQEVTAMDRIVTAKRKREERKRFLIIGGGIKASTINTGGKQVALKRGNKGRNLRNNEQGRNSDKRPKRGGSKSLKDGNKVDGVDENDEESKRDLMERLRNTFSSGVGAHDTDATSSELVGVMSSKHKKLMEEYVQSQLNAREDASADGKVTHASGGGGRGMTKKNKALDEKDLYAEIAKNVVTRGEDAAGNPLNFMEEKPSTTGGAVKEGDVGAGGAMLGGTGIAEVSLPLDERVKVVRATEEAAALKERGKQPISRRPIKPTESTAKARERLSAVDAASTGLPMSFASGPGKKRRPNEKGLVQRKTEGRFIMSSIEGFGGNEIDADWYSASSAGEGVLRTDVDAVAASYSHNFKLHTHQWVSRRKEERDAEIERSRLQRELEEGPAVNRERIGFVAARRGDIGQADGVTKIDVGSKASSFGQSDQRERGGDSASSDWKKDRSNDDRLWKSFMRRQMDRGGKRR